MPLCDSKDTNSGMSTRSALAELTPLECENNLPKDLLERCQMLYSRIGSVKYTLLVAIYLWLGRRQRTKDLNVHF